MNLFSQGLRSGIPIGLGYFSVSFAFGIMAVEGGLSVWQAVLISMTNMTSAGQFAGLFIMFQQGSLLEMALAQLTINLRYALMSISLSQKMDSAMTGGRRAFFAFCNTDEIFAVSSSQKGELAFSFLLGLMVLPYLGWSLGTLAGAAAGSVLPEAIRQALGIAIYGMFLAIILPPARRHKPVRLAVILAALLACFIHYVPPFNKISDGFAIIICAVAISALAAWRFPLAEGEETA